MPTISGEPTPGSKPAPEDNAPHEGATVLDAGGSTSAIMAVQTSAQQRDLERRSLLLEDLTEDEMAAILVGRIPIEHRYLMQNIPETGE